MSDPDLPYTVVLTIPMPGRGSAEKLAEQYRLEWAECPEVTIEVQGQREEAGNGR